MEDKKKDSTERRGETMNLEEAKRLSADDFEKLDEVFGGFDAENTKNHPLRNEGESFMEFAKKGSEKIKSDPIIKKILE